MKKIFKDVVKALKHQTEGAVLPLVGLAFAAMVTASGFAIDYTRAQIVSERLQWAVDAAALAAAKVAPRGQSAMSTEAQQYFRANFPVGYMNTRGGTLSTRSISPASGSGYGVRFSVQNMTMENYFADLFGVDDLKVEALAEVNTVPLTPLDVVFSLDLSGSMNVTAGQGCMFLPYYAHCYSGTPKINDAKSAIRGLINTLYNGTSDIRFGLIGWDTDVDITGQASPNASHRQRLCNGCMGGGARSRYLTSNRTAIINTVNAQTPSGNTDGALGMLWAYRQFQNSGINWSNWRSPAANRAIVLLTDGINTSYYGNGLTCCQAENATDGSDRQAQLCATAKSQGINVYTIAYDMRISDFPSGNQGYATYAKNTLRNCASNVCEGGRCYFDAYNASDLNAAMKAIGDSMMTMRLTK